MSEQMAADRVSTNELMMDALSITWNELALMMGDDWSAMKKALLQDLAKMDGMKVVSDDYVSSMILKHLKEHPYAMGMINSAYASLSGQRMGEMDTAINEKMQEQEEKEAEEVRAEPEEGDADAEVIEIQPPEFEIEAEVEELSADVEVEASTAEVASVEMVEEAEEEENFYRVPVFFATNRKRDKRYKAHRSFTGNRDNELHYGLAEVSMPKTHVPGTLETPSRWRREKADPERHILVLSVEMLDDGTFVTKVNDSLADAEENEALIYIHGYNVSFGGALRLTAQIATDLEFKGIPITYSWPSHARTLKYTADEANIKHGQGYFDDFLEMVVTKLNVGKIHIIAHSMGNRLATLGMRNLAKEHSEKIGQVIFASPDVDKDVFSQRAAKFIGKAERYTLYINEGDLALELSQLIHGFARAGERDDDPLVVLPVETIDATDIDGSFLGHNFYQTNQTVIKDIMDLIKRNLAPGSREMLSERGEAPKTYWQMIS
ncbi:MAG: alpha/beta hydrolase [Chloroflexota bacterium]